MLELSPAGIYCPRGGFHVDPWRPVDRAVITHAHGDHARRGSAAYLCAEPGAALARWRLGEEATIETLAYGETRVIDGVRVSLHPAGHVLGSAQVRIEHDGEVAVVSGDYKRAPDPTAAPFEPLRCDTFVTEATFGLPVFTWDAPPRLVDEIAAWWSGAREAGRTAVLFCYALGKAQRILAELAARVEDTVLVHGAMWELIARYRDAGVRMLPVERVAEERRRGVSYAGRLVLAPLSARGSTWMRRFGDHSSALASGWMRVRGERRRRAYDRGFALSDHADWPALLGTIGETGASRVIATHGFVEPLARYLREMGLESEAWRTAFEGEADALEGAAS